MMDYLFRINKHTNSQRATRLFTQNFHQSIKHNCVFLGDMGEIRKKKNNIDSALSICLFLTPKIQLHAL